MKKRTRWIIEAGNGTENGWFRSLNEGTTKPFLTLDKAVMALVQNCRHIPEEECAYRIRRVTK